MTGQVTAFLETLFGNRPTSRRIACTALALAAVSFLLYLPSLRFDFVAYDDLRIVLDHPSLYDEHSLLRSLHEIFVGYFPREEPLLVRDVTWALNSRLFGFRNPLGYHLGNVLLNAADTALLFLFLGRATRRWSFALVVAALFAVLPVHVEPVCWVMGRKDVLCAFFVLLILICEAHATLAAHPLRWRLLGLVLYPLAILSKFSAVSLVLVLAAYRLLAPALRGQPGRPPLRSLLGLLPHLAISVGIYGWYGRILTAFGIIGAPPGPGHLGRLLQYVPLSLGLYVASLFSSARHSIAYLWPHEAIPLTTGERAAAVGLLLGLAAFFVWAARRRRDLLFYGVAFVALLLPYFNILAVILWRADRYVYLASFCVLAIVVDVAGGLLVRIRSRIAFAAVAGGALTWTAAAAAVILAREPAFRDNHALWSYEVTLPHPQVMAFQALAKSFVGRAAAARDPAARERLIDEGERVATAGLRYYESIPWQPPPGANLSPKLDYANLHVQLGRLAALRGEPLRTQIADYRRSYARSSSHARVTAPPCAAGSPSPPAI